MGKIFSVIKKILTGIIGVVFFTFALCMTILLLNYNDFGVTQFGDTQIILIRNDVSLNDYKKGDLILVDKPKMEEIKEGDVLFTYKVDNKGAASIEVGVVGEIYLDEDAISYQNGETYSMDFIAGKPYKVYNKVGTYLSIVQSQWGFLFIILVPIFLVFIYQVYELIIEIKYGAELEKSN